jgi:uncharacterized integral membrane protein (TIGR00698 family)
MEEKNGIILAFLIGILAYFTNIFLSSDWIGGINIGASTLALIFGSIAAFNFSNIEKGGKWMINKIMPIVIILLGFGLDLTLFLDPKIGLIGLSAAITTAITSFTICYFIGKYMNIDLKTCIALGTGGAICGNSAVIAVSPGLKLKEEKVGIILAVINILGLITFLIIPILASFIGLSDEQGGIWAGAVIHAVPQAIAAGESIGGEAMAISTAIKLSRVSLLVIIVPLCLIIGNKINEGEGEKTEIGKIPYFIPGFVISAILSSWLLPKVITNFLVIIGKYMLLPLLSSVGFFITKESMKDAGGPVLALGIISTIMMLLTSYCAIVIMS